MEETGTTVFMKRWAFCDYRYGESFKRKGVQALENSIPAAKMNRVGMMLSSIWKSR